MTLKVELKPGERIIVGRSLLTNGQHRSRLIIEGDEPVFASGTSSRPKPRTHPQRRSILPFN